TDTKTEVTPQTDGETVNCGQASNAIPSDCSSDEESKAHNSSGAQHSQSTTASDSFASLPSPTSLANASTAQQKRPMNAFLIFCKRHRSVVKEKYPHLENRSITKILGKWWAGLDVEEKQKYTELARQYKEAFMKANPSFKWYKTDIKTPQMQPPSPPPKAPPSAQINDHIMPQSPPPLQNIHTNSTPKPPKKRYLESKEFKGSNANSNTAAANASQNQNSASEGKKQKNPPLVSGPPILDIDTMNRVIESALGGGNSNRSFNRSNDSSSAKNSEKESSTLCNVSDDQNKDKSERTKHQRTTNNLSSQTSSCSQNSSSTFSNPDATSSNDKPLNLSSSKVLHTSNQQIIDHYIDKLLSTAPTGNPMPIEMQTSSSSSHPSGSSPSKTQRRERTCKGKRYLEMLNENKLVKKNKHGSSASNDEQNQKSGASCHTSSSSKWVSGGFDLEEHIAALPQLGDKHLVNALNHSKTNKSLNGSKGGSSDQKSKVETDPHANKESSDREAVSIKDSKPNESVSEADAEASKTSDDMTDVSCESEKRYSDSAEQEKQENNSQSKESVSKEEFISHSQGIECDGLTALAEVALQQANRSEVSSQSSS
ncbi:SOX transcription factor-like protein, partial [Dinothrombium tinctorium]